jgi:predicted nuclease of predicted toxin-antitoxin system
MKFLVDAQLPKRLAVGLRVAGHDAVHTLDMPAGNSTTDAEILRLAASEGRIVVTKDADFVSSYHLRQEPERLLLVSTGNIANANLDALFFPNLAAVLTAFQTSTFVELTRTTLIVHG